jgi:hypothetical protein
MFPQKRQQPAEFESSEPNAALSLPVPDSIPISYDTSLFIRMPMPLSKCAASNPPESGRTQATMVTWCMVTPVRLSPGTTTLSLPLRWIARPWTPTAHSA